MSNEQLQILLLGLLAELDAAIDGARNAMPGAAERETSVDWVVKPENVGKILLFTPIEETHEPHTIYGEYLALVPLIALRDAWQERVAMLVTGEAS